MLIIKRNLTEQSSILNLKNPIIFDLTKPPDIHMYEYFDSIHFFFNKNLPMSKAVYYGDAQARISHNDYKHCHNSLELPYGQIILKRTFLNSFFLAHD